MDDVSWNVYLESASVALFEEILERVGPERGRPWRESLMVFPG